VSTTQKYGVKSPDGSECWIGKDEEESDLASFKVLRHNLPEGRRKPRILSVNSVTLQHPVALIHHSSTSFSL
jgi:hypothetical protein